MPITPVAQLGDFKIPGQGTVVWYGLYGSGQVITPHRPVLLDCHGFAVARLGDRGPATGHLPVLEGAQVQMTERIIAWETEHGIEVRAGSPVPASPTQPLRLARQEHSPTAVHDDGLSRGRAARHRHPLDAGRPSGSNMVDEEVGRIFAEVLPAVSHKNRQVFVVGHSNARDESLAGLSRQGNAVEAIVTEGAT